MFKSVMYIMRVCNLELKLYILFTRVREYKKYPHIFVYKLFIKYIYIVHYSSMVMIPNKIVVKSALLAPISLVK